MSDPISTSWLSANGFKLQSKRNDENTQREGFRLLPIGRDRDGGLKPFQSHDDLCIAVAPPYVNDEGGERWHVWIYQLEPYRHIFVRDMRTTDELISLYEGLTGRKWGR